MDTKTAMEGLHEHLSEAFRKLIIAVDACGSRPPAELIDVAKHLTAAQALASDITRASRPYASVYSSQPATMPS